MSRGRIKHPILEEDVLHEVYHQIGMTIQEIAEFCGCSHGTVRNRMVEYNIKRRSISEARREYSDEEMVDWIHAFVHEFGVSPSTQDVREWPGPSTMAYWHRFGSVSEAVQEAGYEPRGDLS